MEVIVGTKNLAVDIAVAPDVSGREYLVVIAKATWAIPEPGQRPLPIPPQPIQKVDVYTGSPGESAMLYGSDLVRYKPRCDVLFNASAHSPSGNPITQLTVAWQVGTLRKGIRVHGHRHWRKRLGLVSISDATPFTQMPLHFGMAFGGTRTYKTGWRAKAEVMCEVNSFNPTGLGWFGPRTDEEIDQQSAPNLEALNDPIRKPTGKQIPVAFSALARHWQPRMQYSGTYDENWKRNVFPFLPDDFNDQFYQCAPLDQQMPYPTGTEPVILKNMMMERPDVRFKLPKLNNMKVKILRADYTTAEPLAFADTIYFEPDQKRFSVVWRAIVPIVRKIHEIQTIVVGPVNADWWRKKTMGVDSCVNCGNNDKSSYFSQI